MRNRSGKDLEYVLELCLVLRNQSLASPIIGLTSAPTAILGLIPLEVRVILHKLHESHGLYSEEDGSAVRHSIRGSLVAARAKLW